MSSCGLKSDWIKAIGVSMGSIFCKLVEVVGLVLLCQTKCHTMPYYSLLCHTMPYYTIRNANFPITFANTEYHTMSYIHNTCLTEAQVL